MNTGYLMLARRSFDHFLWTEKRSLSKFEAWLDLLQLAAYVPTKRIIRGTLIEIGRGELVGSLRYLAERWNWNKDKVASFLGLLESDQMIRRTPRHSETIITVCKYDRYNIPPDAGPDTQRDTGQTDARQRRDKVEESKEREELTPPTPQGGDGQGGSQKQAKKPRPGKGMSQAEKRRTTHPELTPAMQRIGGWFGRQEDTRWSLYEWEALESVAPTEAQIAGMEYYYTATIEKDDDIRRRDVATLLNNWHGELDRARAFYRANPPK